MGSTLSYTVSAVKFNYKTLMTNITYHIIITHSVLKYVFLYIQLSFGHPNVFSS